MSNSAINSMNTNINNSMSNNDLIQLRHNFDDIKLSRLSINSLFKTIQNFKQKVRDNYMNYMQRDKTIDSNLLRFALDSFCFKISLIEFEYINLEKMFELINNRIYCEYYKLLKLISKYAIENIYNEKIKTMCNLKNKYPVYKDLEPYKSYNFDLVNNIYNDIIQILQEMTNYYNSNKQEMDSEKNIYINGLNIDNYITTLNYNNNILIQNINLYSNYLQFFNKYNLNYLTDLKDKLDLLEKKITQISQISISTDLDKAS
jgi:hypothetical protein